MAQHNEILRPDIRYTRADFTALRAYLNRLPLHQISSLYYSEEELLELGCQSDVQLKHRLEDLRDRLILRASEQNPHLADLLRNARQTATWSGKLAGFLVQSGEMDQALPRTQDAVSAWFKPRIADALRGEQAKTLGDLCALITQRGSGWWKPIPRIGAGKAQAIQNWLKSQSSHLGPLLLSEEPSAKSAEAILMQPGQTLLVPMERLALPEMLDGRSGLNRCAGLCLISARHDREAIEAYLYKFRGQEKTRRAYQKELERFLLWCVSVRGVALSSVLQDECEAYKDFIADIPGHWIGPKQQRLSHQWRPFAGQLSSTSQRYAIQALRFFFSWLVDVRYLAGNPWATVSNPRHAKAIQAMQVDKALPTGLWDKLTCRKGLLEILSTMPDSELRQRYKPRGRTAQASLAAQFRLVRAALLLLGETGIRREEAVHATRDKLIPVPDNNMLWELDVLGKRNKWRTVFPSTRTIAALEAHWQDRGQDFSFGLSEIPLLSPLQAPSTRSAQDKHLDDDGRLKHSGFSPDGLYQLIKTALRRIADDTAFDLTDEERDQLRRAAPHAFRHTFGTQAVAGDVPLDVVQKVLGHASLQTTTIYVQAEKQRSIRELGKFFRESD